MRLKYRIYSVAVMLFATLVDLRQRALAAGIFEARIGNKYLCEVYAQSPEIGYSENLCNNTFTLGLGAGLNIWGESFKDFNAKPGKSFVKVFENIPGSPSSIPGLVAVIMLSFFFLSVTGAIFYPFSSRLDLGVSAEIGLVTSDGEQSLLGGQSIFGGGVWALIFPTQTVPLYLKTSTIISSTYINNKNEKEKLLTRQFGVGFMSPKHKGPFLGVHFDNGEFIDPSFTSVFDENLKVLTLEKSPIPKLSAYGFELGWRKDF